jgi:hypothetical protein
MAIPDATTCLTALASLRLASTGFDKELRIVRATPEYSDALGGRVITIGSTPIAMADQKVRNLIEKHETEGWIKRFSGYYLSSREILEYFGRKSRDSTAPCLRSPIEHSRRER